MKKRFSALSVNIAYTLTLVAMVFAMSLQGFAQTAANTDIKNVASATYSDGTSNYSTVSNEVVVTVAKVSGLKITPDGQVDPTVVPGQTSITKTFVVTNIGNFTDQVKFLAGGQSVTMTGPGSITSATVGGVDIFTNPADVLTTLAQNGTATVVVTIKVNANATPASTIQVFLGDATTGTNFDNVASDASTHEVSTVATGAVNGSREARGDISAVVDPDAVPKVTLTVPAGPVSLGSTISYGMEVCNVGARALMPVSPDTQVYAYAAIPSGTTIVPGSLAPGSQYTTSPLTTATMSAVWVNTPPSPLSSVTRIRIPVGASIPAGQCEPPVSFQVVVTALNANTPIAAIAETFGSNSVGATVTDQSGDDVAGEGTGNGDLTQPGSGQPSPGSGNVQTTQIVKAGGVLNGPSGAPGASGPTNTNDDFTNKSVTTGIGTVAPGGVTTASGTVTFTNSLQNTGNADDTFKLTAPTVPAGFTVQICTGGTAAAPTGCVDVSSGGSTTLAVPFGTTGTYFVQVTEPAGTTVLTGYNTVIAATSGIDPTQTNNSIDRLYTGFIKLDKSFAISNGTGVGSLTDPVPGAVITYTINYTNVSQAGTGGNVGLTASNLVITEDGSVAPNTWGAVTTDVPSSAVDSGSGTVVKVSATAYTDTIATLAPGATGSFVFKRTIN